MKIMNMTESAQETREVRELIDAELDGANGGRGSVLGTAAVMAFAAVDGVFEGLVIPLIRTGFL